MERTLQPAADGSWLVTKLQPSPVFVRDGGGGYGGGGPGGRNASASGAGGGHGSSNAPLQQLRLRQPVRLLGGDVTLFFGQEAHGTSVRLQHQPLTHSGAGHNGHAGSDAVGVGLLKRPRSPEFGPGVFEPEFTFRQRPAGTGGAADLWRSCAASQPPQSLVLWQCPDSSVTHRGGQSVWLQRAHPARSTRTLNPSEKQC